MRHQLAFYYLILIVGLIFQLTGCATAYKPSDLQNSHAYTPTGEGLLVQHAPVFITEYPEYPYNLIGTPKAVETDNEKPHVLVDPNEPTIYSDTKSWQGKKGHYTNLIYRIHFSEIPFTFIPFYLGAGKNIGLLVIITINDAGQPLLVTSLHTCGCYLAFIPTTNLEKEYYPDNWRKGRQDVFGEHLPGSIDLNVEDEKSRLHILLRHGTHRVKNIWAEYPGKIANPISTQRILLQPMATLSNLKAPSDISISFFETNGARTDYVINSQKFWERLLISWWAFDWRVGEDKRLGIDANDSVVFYTSLKPWNRQKSDLRVFSSFLEYWGWKF